MRLLLIVWTTFSWPLTLRTVHRRIWLIGIVATVTGLGLQVVALGFGPLMLVQPLLVTALPFASVFSAAMAHRRVDRVIVLGALTCVAGLSAFLLLARPDGGSDQLVGSADLAKRAFLALPGVTDAWIEQLGVEHVAGGQVVQAPQLAAAMTPAQVQAVKTCCAGK